MRVRRARPVRAAALMRLSCSSGDKAESCSETIFVNRLENSRAPIRLPFLAIVDLPVFEVIVTSAIAAWQGTRACRACAVLAREIRLPAQPHPYHLVASLLLSLKCPDSSAQPIRNASQQPQRAGTVSQDFLLDKARKYDTIRQ
jgi:hypothetical protein